MLNATERMPLPFLRLSVAGMAGGFLLFLGGLLLLSTGPESLMVVSIVMMGLGVALGLVGIYYRGCGNNACTPGDQ